MTTLSKARQNALYADSIVDVRDFGAVGDGVTNDTTAIQAAIDAAEALSGGSIYFPVGTYKVSTGLTVEANDVSLLFETGASLVWYGSATGTVLTVGTGTIQFRNNIKNLRITHNTVMTGGVAIAYDNINTFSIVDIQVDGAFTNFSLVGGAGYLQGFQFTNTVASGTVVNLISANDFSISDGTMQGAIGAQPTNGILVSECALLYLNNIDLFQQGYAIHLSPATTDAIDHLLVTNVHCEGGGYGLIADGLGYLNFCRFSNFNSSINTGRGIYLNTKVINSLTFSDCSIYLNELAGIQILPVAGGSIEDLCVVESLITGNSTATPGAVAGIVLAGGTSNVTIKNNRIGQIVGLGTTSNNDQSYGIDIQAGTSTSLIIKDNDVSGNTTAGINNSSSGANQLISNNIGYLTENGGTSVAIASGGTIAHGLAGAPTVITLVAVGGSGATDVVAAANATNITVYFGGGVNTQFFWSAKMGAR
jgi:hypothetical protein